MDGLIFDLDFKFFVGMYWVLIVYGMMVVEYVKMVNGEGWFKGGIKCELEVVFCLNYIYFIFYELLVKFSLNLFNNCFIYFYLLFCFFEGMVVSVGWGMNI